MLKWIEMRGIIRTNILLLYFLLLLPVISITEIYAQETINGQINTYAKVIAVGADWVEVDFDPGFTVPDTLLLIQMKGVGIESTNNSSFGDMTFFHGYTGFYEFLVVQSIVGTTVNFSANIMGSYDVSSFVQLVDVARFEDVSVTGKLEAKPWDPLSGTGGVLALIAEGRLELNADIDVSGQGFRGGISDAVPAICGTGDQFYDKSTLSAGRKGESPASHVGGGLPDPILAGDYARGKGQMGSAGGGGNGQHAGGGGGGSYSSGGHGGYDWCNNPLAVGEGGDEFFFGGLDFAVGAGNEYMPILMGSGGGASTNSGAGTGSDGGNGGGIVFILADTITGNGHTIKVNGAEPLTVAVGDNEAGAGGGGAAGTAVLYFSEYDNSDDLFIEALGGNGGSTKELKGNGGGGGGGMVTSNLDLAGHADIFLDMSGGTEGFTREGTVNSLGYAEDGNTGTDDNTLELRLNGFLFNSIVSSLTGNPVDSICHGTIPPDILGTDPIGGTGVYTYEWERSYDNTNWTTYTGNPTTKDLSLTDEENTGDSWVYFRRIVTSGALTDISKSVAFKIIPLITNNDIAYDTIICNGQTPDDLIQLGTIGGGNGVYEYKWHSSLSLSDPKETWSTASGAFDQSSYDVPALTDTTYYYREVFSGRCYDSSAIKSIIVLPSITNNTAGADQVICEDRDFVPLTGSVPANGDGSYIYEWRVSTDGDNTFTAGSGTNNTQDYTIDKGDLNKDSDMFIRRFVWSGADNVCVDSSAVVTVKMWSDITGNSISSDQTIRAFSPAVLLDATPTGGSDPIASPIFLWEDSTRTNTWAAAQGDNISETYQPGNTSLLQDTTWFRRIVWKAECADTSNIVVINVHPLIDNDTIAIRVLSGLSDTTICEGQIVAVLKGSQPTGGDEALYTYTWQESINNITFTNIAGANGIDYDPGVLNTTKYFRRYVVSGEADHYSDTIIIRVLPNIAVNTIGNAQTICYNTPAAVIGSAEPTGGDGSGSYTYLWEESTDNISWANAAGTNNEKDYNPGVLSIPMYYRRNVVSGLNDCCQSTSAEVMIGIHALPTGLITAVPDDTTCAGEEVSIGLIMSGLAPYDIVLGDANGTSLSFSASNDNFAYKYNPSDPYDYTYTFTSITDANGCVATSMTGSQNHKVYTVPSAVVSAGVDVCGFTADLSSTPSVGTGQWYSFDPAISDTYSAATSQTSTVSVDNYGEYIFWWKETNWNCSDSASVTIKFFKPPDPALLDAGPDTELQPLVTSYTMQAVAVENIQETEGNWTLPGQTVDDYISSSELNIENASVNNLVDGDYSFVWTVSNGVCPVIDDTVTISVKTLIIYSAFSPNNDGINDLFIIDGLTDPLTENVVVSNKLVITDMNGMVVYEMTNYDNKWDGRDIHGNLLPDGTYYYFLNLEDRHIDQKSGYLIIKRGY